MPRHVTKRLFLASLVLAVVVLAVLAVLDQSLRSPAAPAGIVSFELCAYRDTCRLILGEWGPQAQLMAALSLGGDYLFMLLYAAAISLGLLLVSAHVPAGLARLTIGMACLVWLAALADAYENYHLAQMLLGGSVERHGWPAAIGATVKFAILAFSVLWLVAVPLRHARSLRRR